VKLPSPYQHPLDASDKPAGLCRCHGWAWNQPMLDEGWQRIKGVDHHPAHARMLRRGEE